MNKWIEIININLLAAATVTSGPVHQYTVYRMWLARSIVSPTINIDVLVGSDDKRLVS